MFCFKCGVVKQLLLATNFIFRKKKQWIHVILGVLLFFSAYSGSLISSLTIPSTTKPLDSFEDLARSDDHIIKFGKGLQYSVLKQSSDPIFREIIEKHSKQREEDQFIKYKFDNFKSVEDPSVAMIVNQLMFQVLVSLRYSNSNGEVNHPLD